MYGGVQSPSPSGEERIHEQRHVKVSCAYLHSRYLRFAGSGGSFGPGGGAPGEAGGGNGGEGGGCGGCIGGSASDVQTGRSEARTTVKSWWRIGGFLCCGYGRIVLADWVGMEPNRGPGRRAVRARQHITSHQRRRDGNLPRGSMDRHGQARSGIDKPPSRVEPTKPRVQKYQRISVTGSLSRNGSRHSTAEAPGTQGTQRPHRRPAAAVVNGPRRALFHTSAFS